MVSNFPEIEKLGKKYREQVGETAYNNKNVTVKDITKDYSDKFDTLQVCFLSDTHIGSSDFDIKGLMENLQYADSQENAVVFILGDGINSAIIGSKSDAYEDLLNPQEELDTFAEVLKIAKGDRKLARVLKHLDDSGKIAVVHSGNHEDRITRAVGVSPTKVAADIAGVGKAFAPFYANTDLILRQPLAEDGKFHFGVVTHHGTGIRNIDGTFRLLRNVDNADMCVIGHTHQYSMKTDRTIRIDENGEQCYHDVVCMSLPASGGGTYGAGMALPDIYKQTAVWVAVSSQPNPYADSISPTGIRYPKIVPAFAFFTPTNALNTHIKEKRARQAMRAINSVYDESEDIINNKINDLLSTINCVEKEAREEIIKKITEKPRKEPKGFEEYLLEKYSSKEDKQETIDESEVESNTETESNNSLEM